MSTLWWIIKQLVTLFSLTNLMFHNLVISYHIMVHETLLFTFHKLLVDKKTP